MAGVCPAVLATAGGLVACSSTSGGGSSSSASQAAGGGTYAIWDPYPLYDKSSEWVKLLETCGTQRGVKVERTIPKIDATH
ncbi:UNVERIFIED_ORG: hypothetical protein FHR35_000601 [Microbispora rosea subsp. rosea]